MDVDRVLAEVLQLSLAMHGLTAARAEGGLRVVHSRLHPNSGCGHITGGRSLGYQLSTLERFLGKTITSGLITEDGLGTNGKRYDPAEATDIGPRAVTASA